MIKPVQIYSIEDRIIDQLEILFPSTRFEINITDSYGTIWGQMKGSLSAKFVHGPFLARLVDTIVFGISGLLILLGILLLYVNKQTLELARLLDVIEDFSVATITGQQINTESEIPETFSLVEWQCIHDAFRKSILNVVRLEKELLRASIHSELGQLASQVAHDIRSPLSALTMMTSSLDELPEGKRVIMRNAVRRINDIANQLLDKGRIFNKLQQSKISENDLGQLKNEIKGAHTLVASLLSPLIDIIVSEKRVLFRDKQLVEIEADINQGYGLFANVNAAELKRAISNLINNSIEAFVDGKGRVTVAVRKYGDQAVIIIQDNGKGIPEHILERLGQVGVTHGKAGTASGSGLGVAHAKTTAECFGGTFSIASREGKGTTITMTLPQAPVPTWFVAKLTLSPNMKVISLDDDLSIHGIWKGRFQSQLIANSNIEHMTFTSGQDFKSWFNSSHQQENFLYLIDFELLNQTHTGLDIIEEMGLGAKAILVTSRYEEDKIRERCEKLNVRLIPKPMAGFVPIEITRSRIVYDAILIDDDSLVHMTWNMMAKEKSKSILCFESESLFQKAMSEIDQKTPIFIDMNLSQGVSGIEVAKRIYDRGFKNIHLATGYDADSINKPDYIKSIVGKDFPLS